MADDEEREGYLIDEFGRRYNLPSEDGSFVVGRNGDCDIVLSPVREGMKVKPRAKELYSCISREHALIHKINSEVLIQDLDSKGGTFVDGIRVSNVRIPIRDGDPIFFAGLRLTYLEDVESDDCREWDFDALRKGEGIE